MGVGKYTYMRCYDIVANYDNFVNCVLNLTQEASYGTSSQHFDASLKVLLVVTKFNRAKLVVIAIADYNFAENSNNLWSADYQESRF